jgi:uncharacterized protein (DUF1800 family)
MIRRGLSIIVLIAIFSSNLILGKATTPIKPKTLDENKKILHILNRLSFGPRPGDLEKVKSIGLQAYIELQLNPERIDDSAVEAKLADFNVLKMRTAELFMKYPNPGAILQYIAQKNGLNKGDLADLRKRSDQENTQMNPKDEERMKEYQRQVAEIYRQYGLGRPNEIMQQVIAARILRAVYSERQLQEIMVDFWANHFNVYSGKGAVRWYIPSYERDVIRKHALGNFRDLLLATAQHPAMLFYLDNFQSVSPNSQNALRRQFSAPTESNLLRIERLERRMLNGNRFPKLMDQSKELMALGNRNQLRTQNQQRRMRGINENYARELLELHTMGVDGGYTQQDIIEVAKCFTGWTIFNPYGYRKAAAILIDGKADAREERLRRMAGVPDNIEDGEFYFNERLHEKGPKYVLGHKIDEGGIKDGIKVIDILVSHPSTARFIAKKLAIRFVSDNPSEALINRVAKAFSDSKGDIKTTLRALFNDPEFFAAENYKAKIKTPLEFMISALRALNAEVTPSRLLISLLNKLGEVPYGYQAPTGYPDTAEEWVSAGALLERMNFAIALASNRIPQTRVDLSKFAARSKQEILDKVINEILQGEVSDQTKKVLLEQIEKPLKEIDSVDDDSQEMSKQRLRFLSPSGNPDIFKAVSLVLGTPEFQRQ